MVPDVQTFNPSSLGLMGDEEFEGVEEVEGVEGLMNGRVEGLKMGFGLQSPMAPHVQTNNPTKSNGPRRTNK